MTTDAATPSTAVTSIAQSDLSRIAQDLQLRKAQVEQVVQLLDAGESVPFIARYRGERTSGLPESVLRQVAERVSHVRHHYERKQTILKSIEAAGRLTDDLKAAIENADHPRRLEDLYLPFRPKKKSIAAEPREKGLEALAAALWMADPTVAQLPELLPTMVDSEKQLNTPDDVLNGAKLILAELIGDTADVRGAVRRLIWDTAKVAASKHEKLPEGKGLEYKDYFKFTEPVAKVPPHRTLALNRGERENALSVKLEYDREQVKAAALAALPKLVDHPHHELLTQCVDEALTRVILPAVEREIRREMTEVAQRHAVDVFARNLRGLLLAPPLPGKRLLAFDPGFRTGCRLVALDENGVPLEDAVIFPHMPQKKLAEAKLIFEKLVRKHQTPVVAIGNGTACRESEELVAGLIDYFEKRRKGELPPEPVEEPTPEPVAETPQVSEPTPEPVAAAPAEAPPAEAPATESPATEVPSTEATAEAATPATEVQATPPPLPMPKKPDAAEKARLAAAEEKARIAALKAELETLPQPPEDLCYVIVNEAGASDYSSSAIAREELPNLDASARAAVSIGRRLQDPLAELVKIDPQHVGVGLYQHDVHSRAHRAHLEGVIESCVNLVGVDVNTAAVPLLSRVAGFNNLIARAIVEYRQQHGPFKSLTELTQVPGMVADRLGQAAGFLRIRGDEPLDATTVHPQHYELAKKILGELGFTPADLFDPARLAAFREAVSPVQPAELAQQHSVSEPTIWDLLDALTSAGRDPREDSPPPIFRKQMLKIEDMKPGMELKGTVLNVVDFGAFVDVGLKDSGLVHISQLANRYVRNPHEVASVGDVVKVWVLSVDHERRRVSLTMIEPGTPRTTPAEERAKPRSFAPPGSQPRHPDQEQRRPQRGGGRPQQRRGGPRRDQQQPEMELAEGGPASPRNTARFERKPPRPPKPLPTLTKEKKEGKAYLNTLGELEAFFKAREGSAAPPPPSPPASEPPPAT